MAARRWPFWFQLTVFVLAYVVLARLAFLLSFVHPVISPMWPPTGLAIAALLVWGVRAWPMVFLGAAAANLSSGAIPLPAVLAIAAGNTLEAVTAAWLLRRVVGPGPLLDHPYDVVRYVLLAGVLATAVSATVGVAALLAFAGFAAAEAPYAWSQWWLGDLGGALAFAPWLLAWAERTRVAWPPRRLVEAGLLLASIAGLAWLAFGPSPFHAYPLPYLAPFVLLLGAFRFGRLGAATGVVLVLGIAAWGTASGYGPFARGKLDEALLLLHLYIEVVAIVTLLFSAVITEREAYARRLRESVALLKAQQEGSIEGILMLDDAQRVLGFNPRFMEIWGIPAELMAARDDRRLLEHVRSLVADWDKFTARVEALYRSPAERSYDEVALVDGRVLERYSTPAFDEQGRPWARIWYFRDVTEARRLQAALQAQNVQLREVDRLKGNLVSAVSHELRTPLTSIVGYAEFLEDGLSGSLTPGQAEYVKQIQANAESLKRLVDDLLDFARLESGAFKLHTRPGDMAAAVNEAVDRFRPQVLASALELEAITPDGPVPVEMDAQRIGQVLANLIGNAIKFTPPGGRVQVSLRAAPGHVRVEVADSGIGIDTAHLPHLFERFYQAEGGLTRAKGGVGLGLAIAKALVEAHGGAIGVESRPGQGAIFWFELPAGPALP